MKIGNLDIYARIPPPDFRWAWLAVVKEGPSVEFLAVPFLHVTVSWGIGKATDRARVWAWRMRRRQAVPNMAAGEG
jgi:hypothetical protein